MQNALRRPHAPAPKDSPNDHNQRSPQPRFHLDLEHQRSHRHPDKSAMSSARAHLVAMSGEFVGTILFLFFSFGGTQIANTLPPAEPTLNKLLFISLSFGFSLATTAWAFYRISGGLFNPAVTLGLMISDALPWPRGLLLFPPQLLGGIVAAALVSCMFPGSLAVETNLTNGTSIAQGVFIEMFLTAELVITILMLAAEKSRATFIAPIGIGLALFVAELTGVYFTGGSLNPTRSFGPCVVNRHFPGYHWIYWLGPFLGACLASGYYRFAKYFNYEEANPGQDDSRQSEASEEKAH